MSIVCVGNAICDLLASVPAGFVEQVGLTPGSMNLIDAERANELRSKIEVDKVDAGGSAANTAFGIASFGGKATFTGRIADDEYGKLYMDSLASAGVRYAGGVADTDESTGTSVILIEPGGQRTMNTNLGAANLFSPADITSDLLADVEMIYVELYLWDQPTAREAITQIVTQTKAVGVSVALSLSDVFCIERHSESVLELIRDSVDIAFGNTGEWDYLLGLEPGLTHTDLVDTAWITKGPSGAQVITSSDNLDVAAVQVASVIDTTGAGDQFAAGVLYGTVSGLSLAESGRLGSEAAAEVISHIGPRPQKKFSEFL